VTTRPRSGTKPATYTSPEGTWADAPATVSYAATV